MFKSYERNSLKLKTVPLSYIKRQVKTFKYSIINFVFLPVDMSTIFAISFYKSFSLFSQNLVTLWEVVSCLEIISEAKWIIWILNCNYLWDLIGLALDAVWIWKLHKIYFENEWDGREILYSDKHKTQPYTSGRRSFKYWLIFNLIWFISRDSIHLLK